MLRNFQELKYLLNTGKLHTFDEKANQIILNYSFFYISEKLDKENYQIIFKNFQLSEIILIYQPEKIQPHSSYLLIGFKQTILIIKDKSLHFLNDLFSLNREKNILFTGIKEAKIIFDKNINAHYKESHFNDKLSQLYLYELILKFTLNIKNPLRTYIPTIISYLTIIEAYNKTNKDRINFFLSNHQSNAEVIIKENEYSVINYIESGYNNLIDLAYNFVKNELFLIKFFKVCNFGDSDYLNREYSNYQMLHHPFIPEFYGKVEQTENIGLAIEFINGHDLSNIKELQLEYKDRIKIIFDLMIIIEFLHRNHFIYRDLKPNNVMINENKNAFLINFKYMLKYDDKFDEERHTNDVGSILFVAPEIDEQLSYKCDIYSLGKMIFFIMKNDYDSFIQNKPIHGYPLINELYKKCTQNNPNDRPLIEDILLEFYFRFYPEIQEENLAAVYEKFYSDIYDIKQINGIKQYAKMRNESQQLALSKNKDAQNSQHLLNSWDGTKSNMILGCIYYKGQFIEKDIDKSIFYYTKAADKNNPEAQFCLGVLYESRKDIGQAIHFYTLAAKQNHLKASFNLGNLYQKLNNTKMAISFFMDSEQDLVQLELFLAHIFYEDKHVEIDFKNVVYYYKKAAKHNNADAQFNLGVIYSDERFEKKNYNEAIEYYTLAANQGNVNAQFNLGVIYSEGKFIQQDLDKAIHFYELASNQGHADSRFNLGVIYYEDKYLRKDINKAIHYFKLAAKQNNIKAQFNLGLIYSDGKFARQDLDEAIHFYELASNQGHADAQFKLGVIYYEDKYLRKDINKAIHYFSLAAEQNNIKAQFNLGLIYNETRTIDLSMLYYKAAAVHGHADAQFNLGVIYYEDKYLRKNLKRAIYYFTLAANNGNLKAQFNLGVIYSDGKFINQDVNKAIYYYELAANQNHVDSQISLGVIYSDGRLIKPDVDKAIRYFTLAADQENAQAQFNLGVLYSDGRLIKPDARKAIHYYKLAANADSQFNLGVIYIEGRIIEPDVKKSIHYFTRAADQNNIQAIYNLGVIYSDQRRDASKAIYYYKLAAKQNHPDSLINLGVIYLEGTIVDREINSAIFYLAQAADLNNVQAQYFLGVIYSDAKLVPINMKMAIYYFTRAADQKNIQAQFNLGKIYSKKYGYACDINKAIHYYSLAADQNHADSLYKLGVIYQDSLLYSRDYACNLVKAVHYFTLAAQQNHQKAKERLSLIQQSQSYKKTD